MKPNPNVRGSGMTTYQIRNAPKRAVFIWVNSDLSYPKTIARKENREDLRIVSPSWLSEQTWRGLELSGVIVDHAAWLNDEQYTALENLRTRIFA